MKHKPHQKEKKALSIKGLLDVVRKVFVKIPRIVKRQKITMTDCLMSALAMFGIKSPSLLAFDGPKLDDTISYQNISASVYLSPGDIIRPHTDSGTDAGSPIVQFSIVQCASGI